MSPSSEDVPEQVAAGRPLMRAEGAVRAVTADPPFGDEDAFDADRAVVDVQAERDDLPLVVERQGAHLRVDRSSTAEDSSAASQSTARVPSRGMGAPGSSGFFA